MSETGYLFKKDDRVRLTEEGERVLRLKMNNRIAKHRSGVEMSKTGIVMSNSRGSVVRVRFDSDTECKTVSSFGCSFWELY